MNISEHITFFEQEMKRRNYGQQTIENYSSCLKKFFSQSVKDHPKNINERDIRNFLGTFSEPNTQRAYHSAIKKFYEVCLGQKEKFKYIPYAKKSSKLPIVLSVEEVQRMFDVCENKKHRLILALLYSCSLRVSEVTNLKISDMDGKQKLVLIRQSKGKKDRYTAISENVLNILREYFKEFKPKEYLFEGQYGGQYTVRSCEEIYHKYIDRDTSFHNLRHSGITSMIEAGTNILAICAAVGHNRAQTTAIYYHVSPKFLSQIQTPI